MMPLACIGQGNDDRCPDGSNFGKQGYVDREISGFELRITGGIDHCAFAVRDAKGAVILQDLADSVEPLPEMYVLRIGTNDLVIETATRMPGQPLWTYYIVTPVPAPHLAAKIQNQQPLEFLDFRGIELNDLVTRDGVFATLLAANRATLDRTPCSPMPAVHLRFVRGQLRDVGPLFQAEYDREVTEARSHLTEDKMDAFRRGDASLQVCGNETAANILRIVLAYLYSGREEQAWKELAAMWPPGDVERTKQEILKARERGILRYTRE